METPNEYRKYAEECRRLAESISGKQHKAILEEMAEMWLRLAVEKDGKDA